MRAGQSKISSGCARRVPQPLRFVAVDRRRALGQRFKVHADDRQTAGLVAVAEHRDGELGAGEIGLDEHRLGVGGEQLRDLLDELAPRLAEAPHADALARALEGRLHEQRERELDVPRVGRALGEDEGRRGHAVVRHHFLGAPLVEREAEGQRVGGVARDAEELADGRDVSLAVRAVEPLGDVEHEVGLDQREPRGEAGVGLEPVDLADGAERALHRIDGGGLVPLGVEIGLGKVVAERPTVGIVRGGGVGRGPGCVVPPAHWA